ncbi:MAG: TonB-dependent receptor, partial [Chitinophagaceae bacterium]
MNCATPMLFRKFVLFVFSSSFSSLLFAQQDDSTVSTLSTVEVSAYGQVRKLKDVPAAVGYINKQMLNRFSPASAVAAMNTVAGVRMEERSPGSYRFNIRGSSLRSPFGVRNVKVYYNDIPFTDPGGHTYLNGLGYYNFNSVEILKGPGSSLYGAGTGGVLLIEGMSPNERANVMAEYTTGSFGLHNAYAGVTTGDGENKSRLGFQHQQSDGFRDHSALRRNILSWSGHHKLGETQVLKTTFLYSDLYYQTPGALTKTEFEANPRASRPGGGGFPSAVQSRAAIYQKTFLAGASLTQKLTAGITNQSVAYASFTELRNPTIRNYGKG